MIIYLWQNYHNFTDGWMDGWKLQLSVSSLAIKPTILFKYSGPTADVHVQTDWLHNTRLSFPAGLPWRSLAQCLAYRQHAPQFGVSSTNCTKESWLTVYCTGWQHTHKCVPQSLAVVPAEGWAAKTTNQLSGYLGSFAMSTLIQEDSSDLPACMQTHRNANPMSHITSSGG